MMQHLPGAGLQFPPAADFPDLLDPPPPPPHRPLQMQWSDPVATRNVWSAGNPGKEWGPPDCAKISEMRTKASVLKQDPNVRRSKMSLCEKVKKNVFYYDKTQRAKFWGVSPIFKVRINTSSAVKQ